ncbi:tyrosine-type recombinase/integrase [Streptomyces filamentosus]|uniref:tyrosine-type recombinase/integrase n=1 Tax=Streptomyces filamentosus TaxID=67294 RepID=UPI001671CB7D|nr:integrase [Streptomyces filamentosus]
MADFDQFVHVEWRGNTCRVKWWAGEFLPNGRKRYESKGGFTDEGEAYRHGQDKLYEIRHGTHIKNRDRATLMDTWLDDWLAAMDYAYSTELAYRSRVETHIRPYFRHLAIGDIDPLTYRAFKKHIQQKVGPATAKNVLSTLGMILDDAVPRLIKTSPVERTKKRGKFVKKPKERKRDVSEETVEALARNARVLLGEPGYVMIWTMAMTGMRPGELFGLTREYCYPAWPASDLRLDPEEADRYDEDLERYGKGADLLPAIRVERQAQRTKRVKGAEFFPPKYGSQRTLVIPPFLADMLEAMLASHSSRWVFPAYRGGCLAAGDFNGDYWYEIRGGADERPKGPGVRIPRPAIPAVPEFQGKRMYLLRHSHKAWLDEELEHSRYAVEARMGHEMDGVEGIYSSVTVPMERAITRTLQGRWDAFQRRSAEGGDS